MPGEVAAEDACHHSHVCSPPPPPLRRSLLHLSGDNSSTSQEGDHSSTPQEGDHSESSPRSRSLTGTISLLFLPGTISHNHFDENLLNHRGSFIVLFLLYFITQPAFIDL